MHHNSLSVSTHSPSPALSPSLPHQTNHTPTPPSPQAIKSEPGTVKPEPMDTASTNSSNMLESSSTMQAILAFLKKNNLTSTEEQLKAELAKVQGGASAPTVQPDTEVGNVLAAYKSDDDPTSYEAAYSDLEVFVENSLDMYRHELALILYPVFVHMYLELVYNQHEDPAKHFIALFGPRQESYYQEDIKKLSFVTKKEHMKGNELMDNFNTSQFTVRMSRDTYTQLRQQKKHLSEKKHSLLWNVIQEHLYLDVYEGLPRSKSQIDSTAGAMTGEANRQANKAKVYYGLLREPDVAPLPQEEDEEGEDGDKPKKKKKKENILAKKSKNDPNAPIATRMPFPEMKDSDKMEKARAIRESYKRANLGPDNIPSICMYSLMNVSSRVTSVNISDDSSLVAAGFSDSIIKVWTLLPHKLRKLKSADALKDINREADDVLHRMMEETSGETSKSLVGHSGPVYGLSFNPDKSLLLSCGEDGVARLWSLQTWTCLVCYKGHMFPAWCCTFSPSGYYFATSGHDRTARLWATDQSQPLRIFHGHFSDVDCLAFHPNSNYVGTGSSDRSLRLWDCVTGNCVRLMTGHKSAVLCLAFSPDGRFLASGSSDRRVLVWDIAYGHLLAELSHHKSIISGLAFSREGTVLASSAIDSTIAVWDFAKLTNEAALEDVNVTHNPDVMKESEHMLLGNYRTKNTPVLHLHFTRRNLLLASGPFEG
eukprot:TRINITY_DN6978_c0_g1_i1.p1 TRINITY_DN6978_c0_g1~~TRINITY_DN6978_c0_g1_i1.p1  ORF type:complete len:749 (-),score=253.58 TRINITY_DN6978_c0_g1_i1:122-2248(-)